MDQGLMGARRFDPGITARGHLAQTRADHQQQVALHHRLVQRRVDTDPHITGIIAMTIVEPVLRAEAAADRQVVGLGKTGDGGNALITPAWTAEQDERLLGLRQHGHSLLDLARLRRGKGCCGRLDRTGGQATRWQIKGLAGQVLRQ